jgi:hypothetical protein
MEEDVKVLIGSQIPAAQCFLGAALPCPGKWHKTPEMDVLPIKL